MLVCALTRKNLIIFFLFGYCFTLRTSFVKSGYNNLNEATGLVLVKRKCADRILLFSWGYNALISCQTLLTTF